MRISYSCAFTESPLTEITCRGGLEMLFADKRRHTLDLPSTDKDGSPLTIASLIRYLHESLMQDSRKELFVLDDHL